MRIVVVVGECRPSELGPICRAPMITYSGCASAGAGFPARGTTHDRLQLSSMTARLYLHNAWHAVSAEPVPSQTQPPRADVRLYWRPTEPACFLVRETASRDRKPASPSHTLAHLSGEAKAGVRFDHKPETRENQPGIPISPVLRVCRFEIISGNQRYIDELRCTFPEGHDDGV